MNRNILFSRMRHSYFFIIGLITLCFLLFSCYIVPLWIDWDPETTSLLDRFIPPEGFSNGLKGHVLGTDSLGRDVLIRLLIGGQYSIRVAFICVFLQMFVGAILGILAGYFGGWVDNVIMRACDAFMSMPALILAIAVMAILGQSTRNLIIVLTITGWVYLCKVTRNNVRVVKEQEFVLASKALGTNGFDIMFRQIFPNVTTNIIILTSQSIGIIIILESGLSYLGLGIPPPTPSWGHMISSGRMYLTTQPYLTLVPGFALMLAVLSFNFMGDGIRDVLDTKRKK